MRLRDLVAHLDVVEVRGDLDVTVDRATRDSRQVDLRAVFVAVQGERCDGHQVAATLDAGAVVVERDVGRCRAPCVRVRSSRRALALASARLAGMPSESVRVVGVTGTNGKTTVCTLLDDLVRRCGVRSARVGTTGWVVDGAPRPSRLTTPEAPALQGLLAELRDDGIGLVAMEVSSIGLVQHRVDGIGFELGVFTNLSRDHLDFHGDMDAYAAAKGRLFGELLRPAGGSPRALLCADDPAWTRMGAPADRWTYGFAAGADVRIDDAQPRSGGTALSLATPLGPVQTVVPLPGRHNAVNAAATVGAALLLGLDRDTVAAELPRVPAVRGRLEPVGSADVHVYVDYAHTPDALSAAIAAASSVGSGKVWVVFGCGGDRDPGKRADMGRVAQTADRVVVTSDNPRSEDPLRIVDAILAGMDDAPALAEPDRRRAICWAVAEADPGDVVLIAGKGHETTQIVAGRALPFDDRAVARAALEAR